MKKSLHRNPIFRHRQLGAVTMFSAVLILILLTAMTLYAVQVGVFEQRKSANEMMQKLSFHTADSGIQQAKHFFAANGLSIANEWMPDGADPRWVECGTMTGTGIHPCFGEPVQDLRDDSYVYTYDVTNYPAACQPDDDDDLDVDMKLPNCWGDVQTSVNEKVTMYALLCMLEIDASGTVQGCTTDVTLQDPSYFMVTLLARGEADCIGDNCQAETLIAEKIASYKPGKNDGGPGAPLTARTNVPLSGTVEIVPNPNGGGVGVPISSWVNANAGGDCPISGDPISPESGSYATCERHEWYGQDTLPPDYTCPTAQCSCDKTKEKMLTYASGNDREMGVDIVADPDFPCDLFGETFGLTPEQVKEAAASIPGHLLEDCSSLDTESRGIYWVSGADCLIKDQVGSNENIVYLISAATTTRVSANASFFGILMVTDIEDPDAEFTGNGTATIYGAAIMDAEMDNFNGTFQIVYVEELVKGANEIPLLGVIAGGWTDFHDDWR